MKTSTAVLADRVVIFTIFILQIHTHTHISTTVSLPHTERTKHRRLMSHPSFFKIEVMHTNMNSNTDTHTHTHSCR
jgi:hypothetical protein